MFKKEIFKNNIQQLQTGMTTSLRGKLDNIIEVKVIEEFSGIFLTMADRYSDANEADKNLPALQRFDQHPKDERVYHALLDLLEKMELDFSQKFAMDLKHDLEKEVEIGKIKIAILDGTRRGLNSARLN